jgi:hypothetical protein
MLIEYKFWYINRDDDGFIDRAAIRFFSDDASTGAYQRTSQFTLDELRAIFPTEDIQAAFGDPARLAVVFTPEQFGVIKTDQELARFATAQLAKFGLVPIPEQR